MKLGDVFRCKTSGLIQRLISVHACSALEGTDYHAFVELYFEIVGDKRAYTTMRLRDTRTPFQEAKKAGVADHITEALLEISEQIHLSPDVEQQP